MLHRRLNSRLFGAAVLSAATSLYGQSRPATAPAANVTAARPSVAESRRRNDSAVCLARSADGLVFHETGQMVFAWAASPSLVGLPSGTLLVTVDSRCTTASSQPGSTDRGPC